MISSSRVTTASPSCAIGCAPWPAERTRVEKGASSARGGLARAAEAAAARRAARATPGLGCPGLGCRRLTRQQTFPLRTLARKLARAAHGLRLLADPFL